MYTGDEQKIKQREQKITQDKVNMRLNNLEQKLGYDEALCHEVAGVICRAIELSQLVDEWDRQETSFQTLIKYDIVNRCIYEHNRKTNDIYSRIKARFEEVNKQTSEKTYEKVRKTIKYCIENASEYEKSDYYHKYWVEYRAIRKSSLAKAVKEFLVL